MANLSPSTRHVVIDPVLGPLTVVRDDAGLTGVYFRHHWTRPDPASFGPRVEPGDDHGFDAVIVQLGEYLCGERREFDLALTPHGSFPAQQVWKLLTAIPYGRTTSYGELARQLGGDLTAQDVGRFVGANPLSILIPCHRVVGAAGQLTGCAGGLKRKRHLLELEGALPAGLF